MRRAALALLVSLSACGPTSPAPRQSMATVVRDAPEDDDLLAVVPAEAEVVLSMDVAQLRVSRWTREVLKTSPTGQDGRARGFDQITDVDTMVMARLPGTASPATLTLAQGRFDHARLEEAFRARSVGTTVSRFRGRPLWTAGDDALALVTSRTIAAGTLVAVRGAIDAAFGRAPDVKSQRWLGELRATLAERRERAPRPAIELAVRPDQEMRQMLTEELGRGDTLERMAARLDVGRSVQLSIVGHTRSRGDAADLAARFTESLRAMRVRPFIAALGLGPVLDEAEVAADGALVLAELQLDERRREEIARRLAVLAQALAARRAPSDPEKSP